MMNLGSGTKGFTATAIMKLADTGKLNLDDPVYIHTDEPMLRMWNTTLVDLYGERVKKVTVRHLIFMKSGIQDFDYPSYDYDLLENGGHKLHEPLEMLQFVANMTEKDGCETYNCTWTFEPGTHTQYSSTNFIIAGIVILKHAPEDQNDWKTMRLEKILGLDTENEFKNLVFPPYGTYN
jgi:D-alanyl-D-alanine carboxypeptidase